MATQVGIRELRDNLTALMRRVRDGETIEVTHHGRPIALISPTAKDWRAHLIATGELRPALRSWGDLPAPLPATGPVSASEALQEDRGE
jgi:prevent-host-death family protein